MKLQKSKIVSHSTVGSTGHAAVSTLAGSGVGCQSVKLLTCDIVTEAGITCSLVPH
jgi:hypothetical protein